MYTHSLDQPCICALLLILSFSFFLSLSLSLSLSIYLSLSLSFTHSLNSPCVLRAYVPQAAAAAAAEHGEFTGTASAGEGDAADGRSEDNSWLSRISGLLQAAGISDAQADPVESSEEEVSH